MSLDSLQDLFVDELKDVYNAEKQLVRALPKMAKAASSKELRRAFTDHLSQTERHVRRLERIFKELDMAPRGKKCHGMEGLIEEGKEMMEEDGESAVIDAGLISAAQRVEHYEMAAYGCLRNYAALLNLDTAVTLLEETLAEEKAADKLLSNIADGQVNRAAAAVAVEEADDEE